MRTETDIQGAKRQIKDLTLHELDMVYSLVRVGNWSDSEIGRVYKLSVDDVNKAFDNYSQLREAFLRNPPHNVLPQAPDSELTTKTPRKRRSDAVYATPKERQAAYRARLQEHHHASLEQPSPANETDSAGPGVEELPTTFCQDSVTETSPETADPQYPACYGSSVDGRDVSESGSPPVTPESCSKREELRVIEGET